MKAQQIKVHVGRFELSQIGRNTCANLNNIPARPRETWTRTLSKNGYILEPSLYKKKIA